jgi:hypothetical protein
MVKEPISHDPKTSYQLMVTLPMTIHIVVVVVQTRAPETKDPATTWLRLSSALVGFSRLDAGQSASQNMDRDFVILFCLVVIVVDVKDKIDDHQYFGIGESWRKEEWWTSEQTYSLRRGRDIRLYGFFDCFLYDSSMLCKGVSGIAGNCP